LLWVIFIAVTVFNRRKLRLMEYSLIRYK